jgi:hypothetical protein
MVDAMTPLVAPVSVEVEVTVARTWAIEKQMVGRPA